jgi:hypothetical protein
MLRALPVFISLMDILAAIRFYAAALGRSSRRQIQTKHPLCRVEVLQEIVDGIKKIYERDGLIKTSLVIYIAQLIISFLFYGIGRGIAVLER